MPSSNAHTSNQLQRHATVCLCIVVMLFSGCARNRQQVHFLRFEQLLFNTPAESLQATLEEHADDYCTPLLNVAPDDATYMQLLTDFVSDPATRHIYHVSDSLYHDLGWLEKELGEALARSEKICPEIQYDRFYTLVTGDFDDYQNRVFCDGRELALSIDHYAVGEIPGAVPAYIERLSKPEYMAADCMAAIARAAIMLPDGEMTLLDYAIAEGKTLYYLEKTLPNTPDTILLRYTEEQLEWMKHYTEQVWGAFIQDKLLYSHDLGQFHNFIDEAPKTNAFGDGSAPRTPSYIGWQIVRRYMKKTGASMQELFNTTDSRLILTTSGWRP